MTANIVSALRAELAQLEAEMKADPRYQKMAQIRDLLAMYGGEPTSRQQPAANGSDAPESKADKIKHEIVLLLRERGSVHRSQILAHLSKKRLMGHERNPMGNLAAYLSDWRDTFASDGQGTFSLRGQ